MSCHDNASIFKDFEALETCLEARFEARQGVASRPRGAVGSDTSCVADTAGGVFPVGPRIRFKTVDPLKGNGLANNDSAK